MRCFKWVARLFGGLLLISICGNVVYGSDLPGFSSRETEALRQAFDLLGITEADLNFHKRPVFNERTILEYGRRLPLVDRAMDEPLTLPGICQREGERWGNAESLTAAAAILHGLRRESDFFPVPLNRSSVDATSQLIIPALVMESTELKERIEQKIESANACSLSGHGDVAELSGDLIVAACDQLLPVTGPASCYPLLHLIDRIVAAAKHGDSLVDSSQPVRRHPQIVGTVLLVTETPIGILIVGGPDRNIYFPELNAAMIIDLGGNDTYLCQVAATDSQQVVSWCIDLAGDDIYDDPGKPSQGAAKGGVAILVDVAGNDSYRCGRLGQAGALLGTAILADLAGDDVYIGGEQVQGYATGGDALLFDAAGNDTYRADRFAQASAEVLGVAVLADQAGNDLYATGGRFNHAPLMPQNYQCFSHGFSIGQRYGHGGGVALLADQSGNDVYQADVFAIATAYWLSLGMLYDGAGHDTYKAHIYNMGAGIHLAAGILMDQSGNDTYTTGTGVAQGCGHDFAVGMLIDRDGDDRYLAGTGTSQGAADENSVALLLDSAGRDTYACNDPHARGSGKARYGAPSVALCLDLEDWSAEASETGSPLVRRTGAYGLYLGYPPLDAGNAGRAGNAGDVTHAGDAEKTEPATDPDRLEIENNSLEGLWGYARLWQVGRNEWAVYEARRRLQQRGAEAIDFIIASKMDETNIYAIRAMHAVFGQLQAESLAPLMSVLARQEVQARRNAMEVLSRFENPVVADQVLSFLTDSDPAVVQHVISIQKRHRNRKATSALCEILDNEELDLYQRVAAAGAVGVMNDSDGVGRLQRLTAPETPLPLRHAAYEALGASPSGRLVLAELLRGGNVRERMWAARGLAAAGNANADEIVTDALARECDQSVKLLMEQLLEQGE